MSNSPIVLESKYWEVSRLGVGLEEIVRVRLGKVSLAMF
jgi:hypothetical protein